MHFGIANIIFLTFLFLGIGCFIKNIRKVIRNIKLGKEVAISGSKKQRWKNVFRIALGQSKMVARPVSGLLHIIVYVGFIIINIEVLEIIIDGIAGTHRVFSFLGECYNFLIATFEKKMMGILSFISKWY